MSQTRSTALGVDQATVSRDASASADVVESSAEEVDEGYGYQVDGLTFNRVMVLRVAP